jgi:uracil-DNA glycosylase family protein
VNCHGVAPFRGRGALRLRLSSSGLRSGKVVLQRDGASGDILSLVIRAGPGTLRRYDAAMRPTNGSPPAAGESPANCRRCGLWKRATQAVDGEGSVPAAIMLVGEQPGEQEDLQGHPFVGPAGRLLDGVIEEAGIARGGVYITNAVKHFKWELRGKRRLHKKPGLREINACGVWLEQEIARVAPVVIVALGSTALRALTGWRVITRRRSCARRATGLTSCAARCSKTCSARTSSPIQ